MSRLPPSHFGVPQEAPRPRTNGLGTAGFVLTIIGFVGCCIPPVLFFGVLGGLLCFFGLFRAPRSLAIVGFFLALLQTAVLAILLTFLGAIIFNLPDLPAYGRSIGAMFEIGEGIERYRRINGNLPASVADLSGVSTTTDGWGNEFVIRADSATGRYKLISKGPDGTLDTDDDLSLADDWFQGSAGGAMPTPPAGGGGPSGRGSDGSGSGS